MQTIYVLFVNALLITKYPVHCSAVQQMFTLKMVNETHNGEMELFFGLPIFQLLIRQQYVCERGREMSNVCMYVLREYRGFANIFDLRKRYFYAVQY